jgi:alpha-beta hydrolase superfamily lysophospholipase
MRSSLLAVLLVLLLAGRAAQAFLAPVPAGAGEACSSSICSSSSSRGARHAHGWISGGRARIRHSVCVTASQTQEQQIRRYYHTWQWRDRYNINYRVEGPETGEPVLLVHGFGASLGHFRKNIPAFVERGYRVYAIDLLGFGGSDKPSDVESFSLELWRDLVVDFIRAHPSPRGAAQWVLCGNSIGSLISLMAAAELPGLVKACVLFNTSGGLVSFRDDELPLIFRVRAK